MNDMKYVAYINNNVQITLNSGEKRTGILTFAGSRADYIELNGNVRIARSQVAAIEKV